MRTGLLSSWNPVKELKVIMTVALLGEAFSWNPVKELKDNAFAVYLEDLVNRCGIR